MTTKKQVDEDTKLILLSSDLVDRVKEASVKRGVSLTDFAEESLQQALRSAELGVSITEAVDTYRMVAIQRGAGSMSVPRTSLGYLIEKLNASHVGDLQNIWNEAGIWYGRYLMSKMKPEETLSFFEKELQLTWNLDEARIEGKDEITVKFTSFLMSAEMTDLLLKYIDGVMESLGYRMVERDYLRGMGTLRYQRKPQM